MRVLAERQSGPRAQVRHKLTWFARLTSYAADLLATGAPVILAGYYNVMPTDLDVYKPERWTEDAWFRPEVREAFRNRVTQSWTDALRHKHPDERIYTFWDYFRNAFGRDAGLRIDHVTRRQWQVASLMQVSTATSATGISRVITRPLGSRFRVRFRALGLWRRRSI